MFSSCTRMCISCRLMIIFPNMCCRCCSENMWCWPEISSWRHPPVYWWPPQARPIAGDEIGHETVILGAGIVINSETDFKELIWSIWNIYVAFERDIDDTQRRLCYVPLRRHKINHCDISSTLQCYVAVRRPITYCSRHYINQQWDVLIRICQVTFLCHSK